jgi:hypothetical protein
LTWGIEITMPSACITESPSPLAIAQRSFWVLFLSEKEYHSGGAELIHKVPLHQIPLAQRDPRAGKVTPGGPKNKQSLWS